MFIAPILATEDVRTSFERICISLFKCDRHSYARMRKRSFLNEVYEGKEKKNHSLYLLCIWSVIKCTG